MPLLTQNFSKTGLCFPAPLRIEPGKAIEVEVIFLGAGPDGRNLHISGTGYIVRVEAAKKSGWFKVAAAFDEPPSGGEPGWQKLASAFE